MRSAHERHRVALTAIAQGAHLPLVRGAARTLGMAADVAPVTLRSRLVPGPGPYAELVVALGPRPHDAVAVACWVARPETPDPAVVVRGGPLGWVSVARVADADAVAATAAGLAGRQTTLVRYHPGSRATVRVVAPTRLPDTPLAYAKVFSDDRGWAQHALAEELAAASGLGLRVPRPVDYDPDRFVLWQREVGGVPATGPLGGPRGPALAARFGHGLAALHAGGPLPTRRVTSAALLLRAERYAAAASRLVPALGDRLLRLLDAVGSAELEAGGLVRAHGSPDPDQWLVDGDGPPGLLDFDRYAWAPPETDLACFLVEVEALGPGLFSAAVAEAFLAAYQEDAGPVDPDSLRHHATLRRLGKVARAARALRADGDRRTGRVLAAAERGAAGHLMTTAGG